MGKIKYWIFKKFFKNICEIYEQELERKERQIHNLKERNKFLNTENEKYRFKSNWLQ